MPTNSSVMVKEFYTNDIVYRFDKRKKIVFGVVVDSYEASSDVDEFHALQKGQIRVLWNTSSREQVWRQNKVRLMSRSIISGDIVRRLEKGKETQRGYCKETKKSVTVQIVGTDKVIENISSNRLHCVRPFDVDDAVCLGSKFGRIEAVDQQVTMSSKCGSVVDILTSINHDIEDYWLMKRNRSLFEACYPGQELICTPSNFEQPQWAKKTKTMKRNMQNRQRFTVQSIKDCVVEVAWYNSSEGRNSISELKSDEIKKLKVMENNCDDYLELSSRRLLKINSSDLLLKKKDWIRKQSAIYRRDNPKIRINCDSKSSITRVPKIRSSSLLYASVEGSDMEEDWWTEDSEYSDDNISSTSSKIISNAKSRKRHYPPRPEELVSGNTLAVEVLCMESKATIVWQDGTEEANIPTTHLYYSMSLDDHEFFPGEWVVLAAKDEPSKYGAVQNVNYLERTATVKWFQYNEAEKRPVELGTNETVSVYDLKKHPKYVFRPGSIVRAKPVQDNKMGRVIDSCTQGYVVVKWIDSVEENSWPQDIEVIPEASDFESDEDEDSDECPDDGQVSWETESIESYAGGDVTDETSLQSMAARLDFVKNRINYLKQACKQHTFQENLPFLRDLLVVYDNSSYLDKLLGTSFFSLKSKHFQVLLMQVKEKAKTAGVELRGRLFINDNLGPSMAKMKVAEKENMQKVVKLEMKFHAQINLDNREENASENRTEPNTPDTYESDVAQPQLPQQDNLCVELLTMLKMRMDLAYAEIISKIGGAQALTIMTQSCEVAPTPLNSTPFPSMPTTPEESFSSLHPPQFIKSLTKLGNEAYSIVEDAPSSHNFHNSKFEPTDQQRFLKAVQKEYKLLKESLPPGVWVRSYGNRIDLLSVIIEGPDKTPYEDGLFVFDMQLSQDYPRSPPLVHYVSYSSERLNPNLYVEGKVCVSLLGTWLGTGTEVWGPNSTLLQLIVSIQGLILVREPYYNEAGYEKQTDTQQGYENSRTYNELVILKLVQSMTEMLLSPPEIFKQEILTHFAVKGKKLCDRLERFCSDSDPLKPEFPLLPVSKGLKLSLTASLNVFQDVLKRVLIENAPKTPESLNVD